MKCFSIICLFLAASVAQSSIFEKIECEQAADNFVKTFSFDKSANKLNEKFSRLDSEGNVYSKSELFVASSKSICGIAIDFSECQYEDVSVGDIQVLELSCRNANGVLYAGLTIETFTSAGTWLAERKCTLVGARAFTIRSTVTDCTIE